MRRASSSRVLAPCAALAVLIACGSRGPLDDAPVAALDGGGDAIAVDALDDAPPILDAGHEAGPAACAGCVLGTCGQGIVECIGQPECVAVFSCVTTTCLGLGADGGGGGGSGGGGVSTQCLLGCAAKSPGGALKVLEIVQCVTGTCNADCGALLGGLGGLGGGFGGGQKIAEGPIDRDAFEEAFSPWPELTSRSE